MTISIDMTRLGHACVRLEKDGRRIVIDPGEYSDPASALEGAEHILITHQHPDHLDEVAVLQYLAAHADATVRAPQVPSARLLAQAEAAGVGEDQIIAPGAGEKFDSAGFSVRSVGGQHAVIHSFIPVVANTGYIIDGLVYHPGDSFIVPAGPAPDTLLFPLNGPWNKMSEMVDFIIAVRPRQAVPVHDILLNELGRDLYVNRAQMFADRHGVTLTDLVVGQTILIEGPEPVDVDPAADAGFVDRLDIR